MMSSAAGARRPPPRAAATSSPPPPAAPAAAASSRDDGAVTLLCLGLLFLAGRLHLFSLLWFPLLLIAAWFGYILFSAGGWTQLRAQYALQLRVLELAEAAAAAEAGAAPRRPVTRPGATADAAEARLALQLRLAGRELTPADYEALLALDDEAPGLGLSEEQLARLPRETFEGGSAPLCCAVCLEDAAVGAALLRLPCAHAFHADCATRWLSGSPFCPVCKACVDGVPSPAFS